MFEVVFTLYYPYHGSVSEGGEKMTKHKPADFVGQKVRLHSSMWEQGFVDGVVTKYDSVRGLFLFRTANARPGDPYYEVRIADMGMLTLI